MLDLRYIELSHQILNANYVYDKLKGFLGSLINAPFNITYNFDVLGLIYRHDEKLRSLITALKLISLSKSLIFIKFTPSCIELYI